MILFDLKNMQMHSISLFHLSYFHNTIKLLNAFIVNLTQLIDSIKEILSSSRLFALSFKQDLVFVCTDRCFPFDVYCRTEEELVKIKHPLQESKVNLSYVTTLCALVVE